MLLHHPPQVVPWNSQLKPEEHDAFFLSNGPGDPQVLLALWILNTRQKYPNWILNTHYWWIILHLCTRQPSGGCSFFVNNLWSCRHIGLWPFGASSFHIDIDWQTCAATVAEVKKLLTSPNPKPIFGICLGHQVGSSVDDHHDCHNLVMILPYIWYTATL